MERTARLLANILKKEAKLGHIIEVWPVAFMSRVIDRVQLYYSLPGVNYAAALRLQRRYPNPYGFVSSNIETIRAATGVTKEAAAQIKLLCKRAFVTSYL